MPRMIAWFVHNPVAANLLMLILIVSGLLALPRIHQEEFPNIEVDAVQVRVPYLGAAPEEVESAVCVRVEEAVEGSEGIDTIRSTASEGLCSVVIELVDGVDKNKVANDIKSKVDAIDAFPGETEKPVTAEIAIMATVMQIAIAGHADERTLKIVGQQLRDDMAALPGVSQVELLYSRPYEISIEVHEQALRRHSITLEQIGRAIQQSSVDIPGGSIRAEEGEILLRSKGQAYERQAFEDIVVLTRNDGTRLTVGDLATVVDGFEESDLYSRLDREPAVGIKVSRVGEEDVLQIADAVKSYLEQARLQVPEGIELVIWQDESQDLVDRLDALMKNARSGLLLVLLILTVFLRFRLALWVAAGIPVAMLGAVALFPVVDISISTMSVMGFLLVLGILVDDAIVVGERVYAHEQMGKDRDTAAIDGAREVSVPVIFGVLTTMATFLPIVSIPGEMGGFFVAIGLTVIIALLFSVIESQLILPVHLAHRKTERTRGNNALRNRWLDLQDTLSGSLQRIATEYYQPAVQKALNWRYTTAAAGVVILALALSLFISGRMVFQFFPDVEGTRLYAVITLPEGSPIERTEAAVRQLEEAAEVLRAELDAELAPGEPSTINHIFAVLGGLIPKGSINLGGSGQSNVAEVGIELNLPPDYSDVSTTEYANRWRELTGTIPDALEQRFDAAAFGAGDAIDVELYGKDFDELRSVAAELRAALETYNGVMDITDTFRAGKQEVQLSLLPEARSLGLTLHDLGSQVRHAFYGFEAQRIQRGKDDIRVMVRYPEDQRRSLGDLEAMRIRTADGTEVPFSSVARARLGRGYTTINRVDGQRVVRVIADVNRSVTTPEIVLQSLAERELADILARHPGVTYSLAGEAESRSESMGGLVSSALLALLLIYALLAIPLQSYLQPLIIMSVIPFGAVGAIVGHLIMGIDLVFFSLLGIVALSGVVVNASLVLVDYINRQRQSGAELVDVVSHAGAVRFRPIILTSVTTFIGLTPLMLDDAISTAMFVPMSVSLGFGVLMGTAITLFLVPCLYLILEDVVRLLGRSSADTKH
ncbi:efflux RND transporter permease subunit [Pseudohalioglobus sediminis]|uniref:Efflux RND transporter permease subunit n=1 Tax=Pseudohalioglobus sediminis TaxID=2606449 RepID=A0A5B0WM55_9GAMM|nr:efflux RND transporter permease subunit [Pseudohalioglobus sediminis]KAA1188170.1 efflux RND transporter permease subunit [Pseudohalioglobus sediminis]